MRTILSILIFFYCINAGLYYVGSVFNIQSITDLNQIDFEEERETLSATANNTASTATFGAANPFGNFAQGIQVFWNVVGALGGGTILNVLSSIGLPDELILPIEVIVIVMVVFALIYLITGRGSELSA